MADEKSVLDELGTNVKSLLPKIDEQEKALKAAQETIKTTTDKLAATEKELAEVKKKQDDEEPKVKADRDALAKVLSEKNQIPAGKPEQKSFNDRLKSAIEEKTDQLNKFIRKEIKSFDIELKTVGDITVSNVTGSLWSSVTRPGIIEAPKRKTHIRSLLPQGQVGPGTTYTYMRENGAGEGAIAPVAEGSVKPQIDIDLIEASVNIETIAGWLRVTRKAMNNIPGFIAFLQSRLPEKLMRVEDAQILYGDGATPNIKGILTSGNYVASAETGSVLIERIINDISLLEDTYERSATGIVMRPADYYSFFLNKAAGSGEYDLPQGVSFVDGTLRILGIPVAQTTALTSGDYVVGDFEQGAQLLTQEGMRIEFFEQDGDNVRYNKVTVRIEETIALPVYGSDYFIKGVVPAV